MDLSFVELTPSASWSDHQSNSITTVSPVLVRNQPPLFYYYSEASRRAHISAPLFLISVFTRHICLSGFWFLAADHLAGPGILINSWLYTPDSTYRDNPINGTVLPLVLRRVYRC